MNARRAIFCLFALSVARSLGACDPVQANAVAALGPEAAGVREGPLHRPGQPCLTCHGGSGPGSPQFTMGGTVSRVQGQAAALEGAQINLVDANGSPFVATTNAAGNFYIEQNQWTPAYPVHVSIAFGGVSIQMKTHIGRDGSCGTCHSDPAGPMSAGHIFLVTKAADFPGGG